MSYSAPPTLGRFLGSNAFVRCAMGPIGSGKSSACVVEIFRRAMEQKPGPDGIRRSRWAVIRNTYGQLRDTTRKTFEDWIPPNIGTWKEQEFTFTVKAKGVEAEILFRALDRPQDVKKLLSLELTGAYINEARELPKNILDQLQGRVGRYPAKKDGGATWFGVWFDTNPPHASHWIHQLFEKQRPEGFRMFRQPSGRSPHAENLENLPPGYYERLCSGKDSEWIRVYVDGEYATGDLGSIYGEVLEGIEKAGRVLEFDHPNDGVFTNWDLGISDATAIWFWRIGEGRLPVVIDYAEITGKSLPWIWDNIIDARGYTYVKHWLPHDARARSLQTGVSTMEQFQERYPGQVEIGPALSLEDGIAAARWLLEQPIQFHSRCNDGLEKLKAYRYQWDEDTQVFSKKPLHNFASHAADSFRYLACVAKATELLTRQDDVPKKPVARKLHYEFTLDELYEMKEADR